MTETGNTRETAIRKTHDVRPRPIDAVDWADLYTLVKDKIGHISDSGDEAYWETLAKKVSAAGNLPK